MSDVVIRAEGLGKKYVIGHQEEREQYVALRDVMARNVRGMARQARDLFTGRQMIAGDHVEDFWALQDVDFEIKRGEVVGVIGRNGAGKSTLLKILSRITEPTKGRVEIRGRVASLLEVGTGFHPELTGRENVYLNGAILGMGRAEIRRKFDEIVAFAEVERFLDTPVKRYSSGMYVRLAFAVAAHLEPEILIVDEVLAVGDAAFQAKSLGKMSAFSRTGMTVILVSHNLGLIRDVCSRGIVLEGGQIQFDGDSLRAVNRYLEGDGALAERGPVWRRTSEPSGPVSIKEINLLSSNSTPSSEFVLEDNMTIRIIGEFYTPILHPQFGIFVHSADGLQILDLRTRHSGPDIAMASGEFSMTARLDRNGLYPGDYYLSVWITDSSSKDLEWLEHVIKFKILPRTGPFGDMRLNPNLGKYYVPAKWSWAQNKDIAQEGSQIS